jgi:hypothetical protein
VRNSMLFGHSIFKLKQYVNNILFHIIYRFYDSEHYFKIASSEEDKLAVFKFRYQIYYKELQREVTGLDHQQQIICDEDDLADNALIFYCGTIKNIKCTIRVLIFPPNRVSKKIVNAYSLDKFQGISQYCIVELGRLISRTDDHNAVDIIKFLSSVTLMLINKYNMQIALINCRPGLVFYYLKIGLLPFGRHFVIFPDGIEVPMIGLINKEFTTKTKSPFTAKIPRHLNTDLIRYYDTIKQFSDNTCYQKKHIGDIIEKYYTNIKSCQLPKSILHLLTEYEAFILKIQDKIQLIHENVFEKDIYLILDGEVQVVLDQNKSITLGAGNYVGEFAYFLPNGRRTKKVICSNATLFVLKKNSLENFIKYQPQKATVLLTSIITNIIQKTADVD